MIRFNKAILLLGEKMGLNLELIPIPGYEKVVKITNESAGLTAIIAMHSTALGPALGGTRIFPYTSFDEALDDVLRLSKGMTYKSAITETGLGGGKSVIIADPKTEKTPELLRAFGEAVNRLEGEYVCAEDVGCTTDDVAIIRQATPYVTGLTHSGSSGNPSPFTAWGTYRSMHAVCYHLFGDASLKGKRVAIQGLGSVGIEIARLLFWEGAEIILADIDAERAAEYGHTFAATVVSPSEILSQECDILAPCALGGMLNDETIDTLRCKAVVGCANNQLLRDDHAEALRERDILYAPDFVVNAGGLVNVTCEILPEGYRADIARDRTDAIYERMLTILTVADRNGQSPHKAAIALCDYRVQHSIGKREVPPHFHHTSDLEPALS